MSGILSMLFSGLNLSMWKVYAVIAGLILLLIGGVYMYISYQNHQIQSLNDQHTKDAQAISELKLAVAMEQKTLESLKADAIQTKNLQDQLFTSLNQIRVEADASQAKVAKHDLQIIGKAHPRLLEQHINKATAATLKQFEDITK